jgi:alkanesulfonate monooxygenase SsuD/methylene tetrahydromethanopterin reductase-like flavin-dependent oxidoreductase (luciferase family)
MQFGLSFLPDANGEDLSAVEYFKTALKLSQIADEAGMSTIKITEHYLHPYGGFCPDPIAFLSAVAACTKRIRLMTGCILPVFHHPVKIASKVAMLDAISNGRVDVGFARAYLPHEFSTFQVSMDGSRDIFERTIDAVIQLWTQKNVSIKDFNIENATSYPQPVQKDHPPIWGAAVMSRRSFAWLGEKGFNLLVTPPLSGLKDLNEKISVYKETFLQAHPNKKPRITLSMPLLIAENESLARALSDQYLNRYIEVWANATEIWSTHSSTDYPGYSGLGAILRTNTPEKMRQNLQAFVGTPQKIIDHLHDIAESFDLDQIIWQIDFGAQSAQISRATVDHFIETVMPSLKYQYPLHLKTRSCHSERSEESPKHCHAGLLRTP